MITADHDTELQQTDNRSVESAFSTRQWPELITDTSDKRYTISLRSHSTQLSTIARRQRSQLSCPQQAVTPTTATTFRSSVLGEIQTITGDSSAPAATTQFNTTQHKQRALQQQLRHVMMVQSTVATINNIQSTTLLLSGASTNSHMTCYHTRVSQLNIDSTRSSLTAI